MWEKARLIDTGKAMFTLKKYVELFEGVANVDLQLAENCEESVSVFVCMCVFAQCCGY